LIVIDASAVIELLLNSSVSSRIADRIFANHESLHVPHLIDLEVAQVLRRYVRSKEMAPDRAFQALNDFVDLPLHRYTHIDFLTRIWELRVSMTAYELSMFLWRKPSMPHC
jgi:predicted nucleic acid-binding protein